MDNVKQRRRNADTQGRGLEGELIACRALEQDGWTVLGRRLRTPAGEVDLVARRGDLVAFIEVKARRVLGDAALALTSRQQGRLMKAAELLLARYPEWGAGGVRFDVLLVDASGTVRRIADAIRLL